MKLSTEFSNDGLFWVFS